MFNKWIEHFLKTYNIGVGLNDLLSDPIDAVGSPQPFSDGHAKPFGEELLKEKTVVRSYNQRGVHGNPTNVVGEDFELFSIKRGGVARPNMGESMGFDGHAQRMQ